MMTATNPDILIEPIWLEFTRQNFLPWARSSDTLAPRPWSVPGSNHGTLSCMRRTDSPPPQGKLWMFATGLMADLVVAEGPTPGSKCDPASCGEVGLLGLGATGARSSMHATAKMQI